MYRSMTLVKFKQKFSDSFSAVKTNVLAECPTDASVKAKAFICDEWMYLYAKFAFIFYQQHKDES